jgi:hypothetical protein
MSAEIYHPGGLPSTIITSLARRGKGQEKPHAFAIYLWPVDNLPGFE